MLAHLGGYRCWDPSTAERWRTTSHHHRAHLLPPTHYTSYRYIIHWWIHSTAGAETQSTVTSASPRRRRRRQKYFIWAFITSPRRNVTRHVGAGPAAQMFTVCFSGRIHFIRRGVIAILIVRCCKVEVQRARMWCDVNIEWNFTPAGPRASVVGNNVVWKLFPTEIQP